MPARLDLRSIRFSKYGRLYWVLVFVGSQIIPTYTQTNFSQ